MKVKHEHVIPAPIEKILAAYADKSFYEQKQKASGALKVECLAWDVQPSGAIKMRHRCEEKSRLPSFLRKADVDSYLDDSTLDPAARTLTWKVTPHTGEEKFFLSGRVEFKPEGDQTRAVYHVEIEIKIPLIGKKAEGLALISSKEETARQAAFLRDWVQTH